METLIGQTFLLIAGNPDVQFVLAVFSIVIGVSFAAMMIWKSLESKVD
ncbi:hypothetical protein [Paenibacillus agricola]|uniref:Uncharacterized protein n=1 Tax=Paenibacillus agricola TaxID=2716264 RepID=A0ABX0JHU0_9BACL|nr:hypothetical protein [Paenibacillus agricola]NHN35543.1 hypothetical protein [Paenibacillus agricola]